MENTSENQTVRKWCATQPGDMNAYSGIYCRLQSNDRPKEETSIIQMQPTTTRLAWRANIACVPEWPGTGGHNWHDTNAWRAPPDAKLPVLWPSKLLIQFAKCFN